MKKKHVWDIVLIGAILIIAAVLFLLLGGKETGAGVVVRVNGEETARYSLLQEGTYELNGGSNILHIEGDEAWLLEADCPDELCVRQGKVSKTGQVITCLPNKLTVTVFGGEKEVELISG